MNKKKGIIAIWLLILLSSSLDIYGQSKQDKATAIFNKFKLEESLKYFVNIKLEQLKYLAIGNDSLRLVEIENQLTDDEFLKRIRAAFDEIFTDEEINDIYNFMQTSSFEKLFGSGQINKVISNQFVDINKELEEISNNLDETVETPIIKFEPIYVDREDGIYATIDSSPFSEDKNIKLEDYPSLTPKDMLEIKKIYSDDGDNGAEIEITFTKEGARKFYMLTKENIGLPLAIVIEKQIVSRPRVLTTIMGGKIFISGDFSENEIDRMIEKLKEK